MIELTQYDGTKLELDEKPKSIISLVPSVTENLIQFGKIPIARTSFCIEPAEVVKKIPVIGGTKTPRISKIISMKPDLVIANQEENLKEHIEEIKSAGIPVWVDFQHQVLQIPRLLNELSSLCDSTSIGHGWTEKVQHMLHQKFQWERTPRVVALIWKNPWMAVGKETYASDLIRFCGGENLIQGRYPEISVDVIRKQKVDILLLPSEPYKFVLSDVDEWKKIVSDVFLFSGEDLFWSGTRFLDAVKSLTEICKGFEKNQLK